MVIIGLLLIALVCLIVGLVQTSAVWFIASVIASVGAGYLLYRMRGTVGARPAAPADADPAPADAAGPGPGDDLDSVGLSANGASPNGASANGASATGGSAEPVPVSILDWADTPAEPAAGPSAPPGAEPAPELAAPAATDEVWVIDGRPRYHLATCAIIQGQDAEPIPYAQADEDGFMPCSLCEPSAARTPSA